MLIIVIIFQKKRSVTYEIMVTNKKTPQFIQNVNQLKI